MSVYYIAILTKKEFIMKRFIGAKVRKKPNKLLRMFSYFINNYENLRFLIIWTFSSDIIK